MRRGSNRSKSLEGVKSIPMPLPYWLVNLSQTPVIGGIQIAYFLKLAALGAVYFITARIGLSINAVGGFATVVWPPTGIALAAIFLLGNRYWPAIALAALAVNFTTGAPFLVAAGMATGNTLEALMGAYLLKSVGFRPALERVRDVIALVLLAAFVSTLISAVIGVTSLFLGGIITSAMYISTWSAWWVGDMLGNLIVAPFILVWSGYIGQLRLRRATRDVSIILLLALMSVLVFKASFWSGAEPFAFVYLIFPFLIWIALRFGQRGNVSAVTVVSLVAILITVVDFDQLDTSKLGKSLLLLQIFMGITAVTFMTLAAVVAAHERTIQRQQWLAVRGEVLKKQRVRLMALNRAKDEFIGLASHQLRTPATGVKQYVGMLLDGYAEALTDNQLELLGKAYECNERQIRIINELLAIAQIDAGTAKLRRQKIDTALLITEVLTECKPILSARHQKALFTPGQRKITMMADGERLRMVLENIVDNASKYSHDGKNIEIKLIKNNGRVSILIKDNGIGIAKKDMRQLFKKFSRIDNPMSLDVGGTGLGLYLAKKIVNLHGGTITVSSELHQGSVFTLNLLTKK